MFFFFMSFLNGRPADSSSACLEREQLELREAMLNCFDIEPRFLQNQLLVGVTQIAEQSLLVTIFQNAHTTEGEQSLLTSVTTSPPFINQDDISQQLFG